MPEARMATILVVDDELGIRALLSEILTDEGHTVELAENAARPAACASAAPRPGAAGHLDARRRRHHPAQGMAPPAC
jgi:CheY-like chemotaxis protein